VGNFSYHVSKIISARIRRLTVHFTTVHANLIEQTTSSIELVVLKRCILVVIRKDSTCLLINRLEQHRQILLSKETCRTLACPSKLDLRYSLMDKIPSLKRKVVGWSCPLSLFDRNFATSSESLFLQTIIIPICKKSERSTHIIIRIIFCGDRTRRPE